MNTQDAPWIWFGPQRPAEAASMIGEKAVHLAELQACGQPVPPFYVVTTAAWRLTLRAGGLRERIANRLHDATLAAADAWPEAAADIRAWIHAANVPAELAAAISHHEWTRQHRLLAVRSSVAGEDSARHSFAGLHESVLGVQGSEEVMSAIKTVWASAYHERALRYRRQLEMPLDAVGVAVIVQPLITARSSGVMFTANPVTENVHELVIHSVFGAGEGLMTAGLDADRFVVAKDSLAMTSHIVRKSEQVQIVAGDAPRRQTLGVPPELAAASSLSPREITLLAEAGLAMERHFGRPQDIEFVIDPAGQLFVVQARPITTVAAYGPAAGNRLIWDNSNIIESYHGVTTPLTFSFIRRAYTIVYYCFAEVMGIAPDVVRKNKHTFENMLGLFRGRVYYNLLNWYRLLRLFPGFQYNKQFLESMMGVKEPVELADEQPAPGFWRRYLVELPALLRLVLRSARNFLGIRGTVRRFQEQIDHCLQAWHAIDFDTKPPHEVMALYRMMEDKLLWNWKAPIINDFYVMVYCGLLRRLCQTWCGDPHGSLANDLLCGEGSILSAEPTRILLDLARLANDDPDLRQLLLTEPTTDLLARVLEDPRFATFASSFRRYLDLYGARRTNELKLEVQSFRDQPIQLLLIIRHYLEAGVPGMHDPAAARRHESRIRSDAEERAFRALRRQRWSGLRIPLFRRVLNNSRLGVKNREQMRFARTRVYDLLRDMIRAIARKLAAEGVLAEAEDIFYLTLDEVWDFIKGTAVTADLKGLVALRRREFAEYVGDHDAAPDSRFETFGLAYHRNRFQMPRQAAPPAATGSEALRGTPCSSGKVTGDARVLDWPSPETLKVGEILVAERTDPGWVPLYPTVSGILIERGSILSHSAIVAREMGIPTIVGIPNLVQRVRTGDRVTMDGATGIVQVHPPS